MVCIASGPSLTKSDCGVVQAWREEAVDGRVIVVNNSFALAPWADVLHACDAQWWKEYRPDFAGERWTLDPALAGDERMHQMEGVDLPGISEHPRRIHTGGNGGYQAIGLAVLWGAARIALLGYDMAAAGRRVHWHADHSEALGNPLGFDTWRQRMTIAAADLRRLGVDVVNCSRATALTCFERMDLARALAA